MKNWIIFIVLIIAVLLSFLAWVNLRLLIPQNSPTTFVVIGDMPYSIQEDASLTDGEIATAIRAINPPVLVHYGDLKGGGEDCTDTLLELRKTQIANLNPYRTVFTPGDNDWTDCDRDFLKIRFDELERLAFIRNIFYESDSGLEMSRDIHDLIRQKDLPENAIWKINDLIMGTLHVVGTNNGRQEILKSDVNQALDAVDNRDAANETWLQRMFEEAKTAEGLVISFQADIYKPMDSKQECTAENRVDCDGHKRIREAIAKMASVYEKPVLVVHGDTSAYCFYQQEDVPNLWRLNGPGDFKVIDAARVTFDPSDSAMPFKVLGLLNPEAPPPVCE